MGKDFENVGVLEIAPSKKSLRIVLTDLPFTTFTHTLYFSLKDADDLIRGHRKKPVTIVMVKGKETNESCEAYKE